MVRWWGCEACAPWRKGIARHGPLPPIALVRPVVGLGRSRLCDPLEAAVIHWPWVSRRAYDIAVEMGNTRLADAKVEIEQLRAQNISLVDHITRLARAERGLSEVPRQPRPLGDPMPQDVKDYINGFAFAPYRAQMSARARRMHAVEGKSWDEIGALIKAGDPEEEEAKTDGP